MDRFIISLPKHSSSSSSSFHSSQNTPFKDKTTITKRKSITQDSSEKSNLLKKNKTISPVNQLIANKENEPDLLLPPFSSHSKGKKVQMYLDFGQKGLTETVQCPECDLLFHRHDLEDLKQHQQYCKDRSLPPQMTMNFLQKCQILNESPLEREKIVLLRGKGGFASHRIGSLPLSSGKRLKTFSRKETGAKDEESALASSFSSFSSSHTTPTESNNLTSSICQQAPLVKLREFMKAEFGLIMMDDLDWSDSDLYLFVKDRSVIGAVIVDRISPSMTIQYIHALDELCLPATSSSDMKHDSAQRCLVGVRYLWVHQDFRRRKVARSLLDEVRRSHLFGIIVETRQIAFTQLTEKGFSFAQSYCHTESIPCYDPIRNKA